MSQPSKAWRVAAALFVFINVAGAGYAFAMGERNHGLTHLALLVVGFIGWQFAPWKRRQAAAPEQLPDARLDYLQQSVDAVALEVERLGEAQRFAEKLRSEQGQTPPARKLPEV
jgi:predicted membrane metal-binding protein